MGLLEDLTSVADRSAHPAGGRCTVGRIYTAMHHDHGPEVSSVFAQKVRDPEVDPSGLIEVLAAYGHEIGKQPIARHRRRDCLCHVVLGI